MALILAGTGAVRADAEPERSVPTAVERAWGFDRSDLPPHPGVRFGVLANGMRYAVMRNAVPAGWLSVRMRVDVGAASEEEREQGFVHLLEHLIFHGSKNIPQGGLPLMLAHQGLRRWSDFNAFTTYDETVYRLDLTRADGRARETGLRVMREVASALRFTRRTVASAKQEVLAEIAGRDLVQDRIAVAQNQFLFPRAAISRGAVTGSAASVAKAGGPGLRRLYRTYYVPERTVLVLVGDFDPAAAEAELVAHFSDWRGGAGRRALLKPLTPDGIRSRGAEFRLFVDPAAPTSVTIASVKPMGRDGDQSAQRDRYFLESLASTMLARRLARLRTASGVGFRRVDAAVYDHFATGRVAMVELAASDGDWQGALQAGAQALRSALTWGFTQAELDAQRAESRRGLTDAAPPLASAALADAIVDAAGRGLVFTRPTDAAGSETYLSRVRLADVNAALKTAWSDPSRLIFVATDRRPPNAEAAVAAAWAESQRVAGLAPASAHLAVEPDGR